MASDSLGSRIQSLRISQGKSIRQQATLIGINHTTLMRWESEECRPNREALTNLLRSFQISEGDILQFLESRHAPAAHDIHREHWSGSTIRTLREQQRLSQDQLARPLGVKQGTVSKWENGTLNPSTSQLVEIRKVLAGSQATPLLAQLVSLRNEIESYDLAACFDSYDKLWKTCSTHPVEYGEHWGVELTKRVSNLAKTDRDAMKLLSWIHSSRAYWFLVRGRHKDALIQASHSIRVADSVGFDLTSGYSFWLAARVCFTKRTVTDHDRLTLRKISRLAERKLGGSALPFADLVKSSVMLSNGNVDGAHHLLSGIRPKQFENGDEGQCGNLGPRYWENIVDGYHKLYGLQSREYAEILSRKANDSKDQPVASLLNKAYDLSALTKVSKQDLSGEYTTLVKEAEGQGLGYAFSTIESHVKRVSGIDLQSRCLG